MNLICYRSNLIHLGSPLGANTLWFDRYMIHPLRKGVKWGRRVYSTRGRMSLCVTLVQERMCVMTFFFFYTFELPKKTKPRKKNVQSSFLVDKLDEKLGYFELFKTKLGYFELFKTKHCLARRSKRKGVVIVGTMLIGCCNQTKSS